MQIQKRKHEDILVLDLAGRLDASTSSEAQEQLISIIDAGNTLLIANLEKLEYISSAGLRVFLMVAKRLKAVNGRIYLYQLPDYVKEIFEISGFASIFPIHATEQEAIAAAQGSKENQ